MPPPSPSLASAAAPRLADIARCVQLSRSGVSRALHNDSSIPLETCRRVQQVARKMGFVVDRNVSRAFGAVRHASSRRVYGTIGLIDAFPPSFRWQKQPRFYNTRLLSGAVARATELGYGLEIFSLTTPGMSARRLQGILDARNVRSLLIPPLPDDVHTLPINWDNYTCVALTHSLQNPGLHRVLPHQYQAAALALEQLQTRGYQRIGFATSAGLDVRVNHLFRAAYLSYQYTIRPEDRLPMLMTDTPRADTFPDWLERHQPDAIVACEVGLIEQLVQHGRKNFDQTGFVSLGGAFDRPGHPLHRQVAHIDQNTPDVGRAGVDQLVAQIERRDRGIPPVAHVLMIEGTWVPGATVRSAAH